MTNPDKRRGFTIVELLIVVVVIAILAAITAIAFNGIRQRANDTRRLSDVKAIQKALAQYHTVNGSFPAAVPNPGTGGWELSRDPGFLSSLSSVMGSTVFVAPGTNTILNGYYYRTFTAGQFGCPASAGPFYVVWVRGMETQTGGASVSLNSCPGQTLFSAGNISDSTMYMYFGFSSS